LQRKERERGKENKKNEKHVLKRAYLQHYQVGKDTA
jgi:hypothetical protein